MEEPPLLKEDGQDRALCALQVAAVSGFAEDYRNIQTSCLFLCNACRDGVPVPKLRLDENVPSSILAELHPGTSRLESEARSRVLPYRRVLKVHWMARRDDLPRWYLDRLEAGEQRRELTDHVSRIDMAEVTWPEGTTEITLMPFDRSMQGIALPTSLVRLAFCIPAGLDDGYTMQIFNQPLDGVTFPPGLRELLLGTCFDQPIDNVIFPEGLERLSMPGLNQSLQNVHWPVGLKTLELLDPVNIFRREEKPFVLTQYGGPSFDQPLDATLPSTLETLWLSDNFNHPVGGVVWPTNLVKVAFGKGFRDQSLSGVVWPSTLRMLVVCRGILEGYGELPEDCDVINCSEDDYSSEEAYGEEDEYMLEGDEFGDDYDSDYYSIGVIDDEDLDDDFVL